MNEKQAATMGSGCFWCTEAVMGELKGVESIVSGYTGGTMPNPSYQDVCSGKTGHAEAVQVTFDPAVISYKQILEVFFLTHDPTTPNRQGNDIGTQYRSAIFYHDEKQRKIAEEVKKEIQALDAFEGKPIVTEIVPFTQFYPAESYHQDYYDRNSDAPYCQFVINPKLAKLREKFSSLLKD